MCTHKLAFQDSDNRLGFPVSTAPCVPLLPAAQCATRRTPEHAIADEQHRPQVGAVWQPQRHAACGHLLGGAAGGSPGGRRAVERPERAAQAAETPRGTQPPEGPPEGRCGDDRARASCGSHREEG